jgi:hypothetical protein
MTRSTWLQPTARGTSDLCIVASTLSFNADQDLQAMQDPQPRHHTKFYIGLNYLSCHKGTLPGIVTSN